MNLSYQAFQGWRPIGERWTGRLRGGTIYFMSAKAVGKDYKKPSMVTFRHSAGSLVYASDNEAIVKRLDGKKRRKTDE